MIIKLKPIEQRNALKTDIELLIAIKAAIEPVMDLTEKLEGFLKDRNLSLTEIVQLISIAPSIPLIVENGKKAFGYLKNSNAKVSKDFSKWFEKEFDLENDVLERKIEMSIDVLADSYDAVTALIKIIPKLRALYDLLTANVDIDVSNAA